MTSSILWVIAGALLGGGFLALARRAGPRHERAVLGLGLGVAAAVYPALGLGVHAARDLPVEWLGLAGFGAAALLGVLHAPAWLVAGWAAHALWDLGLPAVTDAAYVPAGYAAACLGFDLAVAGGVALRAGREAPSAAAGAHPPPPGDAP